MHLFHLPSTLPETLAAVDLGSNSFHMIVARVENNQLKIIDKLREMVRLGAGLQDDKSISEETATRAIACLERFGQRLKDFPKGSVLAVGTNTLRQVKDPEFINLAENALGHPIEIIAGREEARLVYLGVAHGLETGNKKRLVIDIGGGSTELIIGKGFDIARRESLHMGCVSYSQQYFPDGIISHETMGKAILSAQLDIRPLKQTFNASNWKKAVGSSGTIRAIGTVIQEMEWSQKGITKSAMKSLRALMIEQGHVDKLQIQGLSSERKPVFAGGVAVLSALFKSLDINTLQVSDKALREGLLYEMLGEFQDINITGKTIGTLTKRYNIDKAQARRVTATARQLYDQVSETWEINTPELLELLNWAANLHEIGMTISHSSFQKHGAYILEHADLSGFSRQQQQILATLVRNHRRKIDAALYESHSETFQISLEQLTVLLRISVLMHRSRGGSQKPKIKLSAPDTKHLHIDFPEEWLDTHPLTLAEMEREAKQVRTIGFSLTFS